MRLPRYDDLEGLYPQFGNDSWAQKTLRDHAGDVREHIYSAAELELGRTHDALWNAAQLDMVRAGKSACVLHRSHSPPCLRAERASILFVCSARLHADVLGQEDP